MTSRRQLPVVIVGGGLAGLTCARGLARRGIPYKLFVAGERLGGRVATDTVDGFLIDRGFQVLLTAYSETRRLLDYRRLGLGLFDPGAMVRWRGDWRTVMDPLRAPGELSATLRSGIFGLGDALRLAWLWLRTRPDDYAHPLWPEGGPTAGWLARRGYSRRARRVFFKPFFGGVFLDPGLSAPVEMFEFVFAMFARGRAALPAGGMGAIPAMLAEPLETESLTLGCGVERIEPGGVTLANGEHVEARAVVLAADPVAAARLTGQAEPPEFHGAITISFVADRAPYPEPRLALGADDDGPVNQVCVPSCVQPTYAPPGRELISATVLELPDMTDEVLAECARDQMAEWFGPGAHAWSVLRVDRIERALPRIDVRRRDHGPRLKPGLYQCGDWTDHPSIQGAMFSGRLAAQALGHDLDDGRLD